MFSMIFYNITVVILLGEPGISEKNSALRLDYSKNILKY